MNEPVAQMPARASSTFVEKSLASLRMGDPDVCFSVEPISSTMVLKRIRSTSATIGSWPPAATSSRASDSRSRSVVAISGLPRRG